MFRIEIRGTFAHSYLISHQSGCVYRRQDHHFHASHRESLLTKALEHFAKMLSRDAWLQNTYCGYNAGFFQQALENWLILIS